MSPSRGGAAPALFFLARRSLRNRAVALLGKLRQIPYLIALLAGLALFAAWLVPYLLLRAQGDAEGMLFTAPPWTISLAALGLMGLATYWWTHGKYHRALAFSPAETNLLLSGPVGRRTLVTYKLARSQVGILLAVLWAALFVGTTVSWPLRAVGMWLLFTTLHLHQVAAALVRTALLRNVGGLRRHGIALALFGAVLVVVVLTTAEVVPQAFAALATADFDRAARLVADALDQPAARIALLPARLAVAPALAQDRDAWLGALPGAVALLLLHFAWVLRTDAAFEEGAAAAGKEQKDLRDAMLKDGVLASWGRMRGGRRSRRTPFRLSPSGPPWMALVWKNLTMGLRALSPTMFFWLVVIVAPTVFLELGEGPDDILRVVGSSLGGVVVLLVVVGPFVVRNDLRSDLTQAELLRTYPLDGRTVVAAEVAASTLSLTVAQWVLGVPAAALLLPTVERVTVAAVVAAAVGAVVFLPVLNALLLLLQNGMALFLPAWVPLGRERTGGIDQLGTMALLWIGTILLMVPAILPPLLAGGGVGYLLYALMGPGAAILTGALAAWLVVAAEIVGLVHLLGDQWDEMDVVEAGLLR